LLDKFNLKSENASYTYMFVTSENIKNGLEADKKNYLILRIYATHSLSNMGKVFEKRYFIGDFANGDFCFGNSTEISLNDLPTDLIKKAHITHLRR